MPNIKDQSTVEAIALEFTTNGRNKGEALKKIGYSEGYSNTQGIIVVYSNVRVIEAIAHLDAKTREKLEHNRDIAINLLNEALQMARIKKDNAGMVQAIRELDAISNLHSQIINTTDQQRELTESEAALADEFIAFKQRQRLKEA